MPNSVLSDDHYSDSCFTSHAAGISPWTRRSRGDICSIQLVYTAPPVIWISKLLFYNCISFHHNYRVFINDEYARNTGFLEVAEINNIIVLFPQIGTTLANPTGCWDVSGIEGPDYGRNSYNYCTPVCTVFICIYSNSKLYPIVTCIPMHWRYSQKGLTCFDP